MKKKFFGFLVLASFLLLFNTASYASDTGGKSTEDLTVEVLESAWKKFELISYGIGETDPVISIGMDKTKSETKLREYLHENLSDEVKEKYKIEIFKEDVHVLEKEHQEYLKSINE
ncbi:hypothetical protein N0B21_20200 [Bacillus velezensis]|uniref:hypothetical protein n=1 Tax=Bacillus velezensis TaxID=492670 RepID=UPI0021B09BCB|nr:hypothetical protein [Bacillus velezensis]MCT6684506.1 hypothetical protein [Bacillus velezensis]HEO2443498.1 hypothetical protein [Streptococcus agalactiae]